MGRVLAQAGFWGLFAGLAWLTARLLAAAAARYGVLVDPYHLAMAGLFGLMLALAVGYILPWRGLLLDFLADRPPISLTRDAVRLRPTRLAHVVRTAHGCRAAFAVDPPLAEQADPPRATQPLWRALFRQEVAASILFEEPAEAAKYPIEADVEPQLAAILSAENARLAAAPGRGPTRLRVCVSVPDPAAAEALAEEAPGLKPLPWSDYFGGFFAPGYGASGAIACRARRTPAVVEHAAGRFLPLLIARYEPNAAHEPNHRRAQGLAARVKRPILWQAISFAYPKGELGRVRRVIAMESILPRRLLRAEDRDALDGAFAESETLARSLRSPRKPRLLKQVVWIKLGEDEPPRALFHAARERLLADGLLARAVAPRTACRLFAALHPGLERLSADRGQGLGLAGEEDEVSAEMEPRGAWPGHADPQLILEDPAGKSVGFNLFADGTNHNLIIAGESGSGKSVLINGLVAAHLGQSRFNRAILVDYGGSFSGLTQALGGAQIARGAMDGFRVSPLPRLPELTPRAEFAARFPGQSYAAYRRNREELRVELAKQALQFITGSLCRTGAAVNAVFQSCFFEALAETEQAGLGLQDRLADIARRCARRRDTAEEPIRARALADLYDVFTELQSVARMSPFIGDGGMDLSGARLASFNLDGYVQEDKRVLAGLITLLIQESFAAPSAGKLVIVFDEAHAFLGGADAKAARAMGAMLDGFQRVTRKYGASLILASQSPEDFAPFPALAANANHHAIMRLKARAIGPEWKVQDPATLAAARQAEPADSAGFSAVHLGTTTRRGDLEGAFRFALSPVSFYSFTSKKRDKRLMDLALALTDLPDYAALAQAVHQDAAKLAPIGSKRFWAAVAARIAPRYPAAREQAERLFAQGDALLDLFLNRRAEFEAAAADRGRLAAFLAAPAAEEAP